jgi:hypothetical protein
VELAQHNGGSEVVSTFRGGRILPGEGTRITFASADLSRTYVPGRGLPGSLALHGVVLTLLLLSPVSPSPREPFARHRAAIDDRSQEEIRSVMWLPPLGGARQREAEVADPSPDESPTGAPPRSRGLVYPGPQEIISDPPEPTNLIQTLLQPELDDLPILRPPLALPNVVMTASPVRVPRPEPLRLTAEVQDRLESESPPSTETPRLADPDPLLPLPPRRPSFRTPVAETAAPPLRAATPPDPSPDLLGQAKIEPLPPRLDRDPLPMPEAIPPDTVARTPVVESPEQPVDLVEMELAGREPQSGIRDPSVETPDIVEAEEPRSAQSSSEEAIEPVPTAGLDPPGSADTAEVAESAAELAEIGGATDLRSLLALTPLPLRREGPIEVPLGEARGRFAISPEPDLGASETEPGAALGESTSEVVLGDQGAGPEGDESADAGDSGPVVSISFGRRTAPSGTGAGVEGGGSGTSGSGSASEAGSESGPGAGAGSGRQPFAGITIIGGVGATGIADGPSRVVQTPAPVKAAYGLYVVSTESSGGGLPSFGVFSDEQVYTVFLDMRETLTDTDPSWTLQYSGLPGSAVHADPEEDLDGGIQQGLVLPFPAGRKRLALPPDVTRPYLGQMVIVYGVVNPEGRMEELEVKESPDPRLNEPILDALSEWVFRPAVLDGHPVAVKALLGIPLWLPEP